MSTSCTLDSAIRFLHQVMLSNGTLVQMLKIDESENAFHHQNAMTNYPRLDIERLMKQQIRSEAGDGLRKEGAVLGLCCSSRRLVIRLHTIMQNISPARSLTAEDLPSISKKRLN